MSGASAREIAAAMLQNAGSVRFGAVTVTLKVHDGRIVEVTHSKTTQTREASAGKPARNNASNAARRGE